MRAGVCVVGGVTFVRCIVCLWLLMMFACDDLFMYVVVGAWIWLFCV